MSTNDEKIKETEEPKEIKEILEVIQKDAKEIVDAINSISDIGRRLYVSQSVIEDMLGNVLMTVYDRVGICSVLQIRFYDLYKMKVAKLIREEEEKESLGGMVV